MQTAKTSSGLVTAGIRLCAQFACAAALLLFLPLSCGSSAETDAWQEYKSRELAHLDEYGEPGTFYSMYEGTIGPAKLKLATWMAGSDMFRIDNDMGIFSVSMGYDGSNAWIQTKGGKPRPLSSAEETELYSSMYFDTTEYLTDESLEYEITGTENWDGKKVWVIVLTSPDGYRRDMYVSDGEWQVAGYRSYGSSTVLVKIYDVKREGAVAVPGKVEMELANLNLKLSFSLIEAREGVEIDPKLFLMPQGKYAPVEAVGGSSRVGIDLVKTSSGMVIIEGSLGGKTGEFLLDTGASSSLLDSEFIGGAEVAEESGFSAVGVGGAQDARLVKLSETVRLGASGEIALPSEITYMTLDLSQIGRGLGINLAGIIGEDLLTRAKVRIDFGLGSMTVEPYTAELLDSDVSIFDVLLGEKPKMNQEKGEFPIHEVGGLILVDAILENGGEERFIVDTGFKGRLGIFEGAVKRLELETRKPSGSAFMGGIGGVTEMKGFVREFSAEIFGKLHDFHESPVISGPIESVVGGSAAGIIGVEFFAGGVVEFDYANRAILFIPKVQ